MTRRPDGWNSGQMGVRTGWLNRLDDWQGTWISSDLLTLNSGIPVTASLHLSDFVQTQNEAKILTNINPTHMHNRIFMHTISRKYPNRNSNILKAQKLKRIMEDTMKIVGWEEMCKECQNLEKNPREKHTTWHDKNAKMCVWQRKVRKS
jgi:hypothetical protein